MKKVTTTFLTAVLFTFILNAMAWGQLLVEDFSYTPATSLNGQGGWTAHSGAGVNPPQITSGGLTYPGYASSGIGNAVSFTTSGEDNNKPYRTSPNGITSGSLYYSLMVKIDSATATGDYFFHLNKSATIFTARIFARRASNGNIRFGIGKASTIGNINFSDSIYAPGTTHLLVVKHTVIAGATNDTVALWIDPAIGVAEPAPTVFESTADRAAADVDSLYGFALRQGTAANAPIGTVDGIRVDTLWQFGPTGGPLTGTKTIPGDYATLAGAIAALDSLGVGTGGVTFNVAAGYTETAPNGGYQITATGTASNHIVFQKSGVGANPTFTASPALPVGALNDAIIKIIGGDYITINGFTLLENPANTVTAAGTNTMIEFGVGLFYSSPTNGAQNNTIQNCTITLNRTYQNTFGIYSNVRHSATDVLTAADITDPSGANSNLTVTSNIISNVNTGIAAVGSLVGANMDTGLDIGAGGAAAGVSGSTGNTISNYGTTGTFSAFVSVNASVNGIYLNNQQNFIVSFNSIASSDGGTLSGTLRGVYVQTSGALPGTGTFTRTISNNTISLRGAVPAGAMLGIASEGGNSTVSLAINNNDFANTTHTVAASGAITFISNTGATLNQAINNNTFTNLSVNTTGSITFISNSVTLPAGGTQNVNSNSIVTAFTKTGAGGTVTFFTSNASSVNGTVVNNNNNTFSNITVTGATAIAGWSQTDGASSSNGPTKTVSGNVFSNTSGGTSAITLMTVNFSGAGTVVSNNAINTISSAGAITGLSLGTSNQTITATTNTINTLASTGASTVTGMSIGGGPTTGSSTVSRNRIYDLQVNNAAGFVNGITVISGVSNTIVNNLIGDLKAPSTNSGTEGVRGINLTSSTVSSALNIYYNSIYLNATSTGLNFSTSGLFHTTNATGTTATLSLRNNIIVNTSTPAGTGVTSAYRRSSTTLANYGSASNNNDFYAGTPGVANLIFFDGSNSDQTLATYKARVSPRDGSSITENPPFLSTTGSNPSFLHMNSAIPTQIESGGISIAGVTDDYDGDVRSTPASDIGADEFAGIALDLTAPLISYTALGNTGSTGARTLTATITDASGVPTAGIGLPVLYWKVNSGSYTGATAASLGSNQYQFSFGGTALVGDTVSYYICAQDSAITPNVGASPSAGASGFTANPPAASTPPTSPATYSILVSISGSFNVGAAGTYTTLTAAMADLANKFISGPVTFVLTDVLYTTPAETFPIAVITNGSSATNTVTVRPGGITTITGSSATGIFNLTGATYVVFDGITLNEATTPVSGNDGTRPATVPAPLQRATMPDALRVPQSPDGQSSTATGMMAVAGMKQFKDVPPVEVTPALTYEEPAPSNLLAILAARSTSGGQGMTIRNTSTTGSAIQFLNGASNNTVTKCTIESGNTSVTSGTILFNTTTGATGNSNNSILLNKIRDRSDAPGVPANGIYSSGTGGAPNAANTVSNNEVFNFTNAGILLSSAGIGDGWVISGNSIYQTAPRTTALSGISVQGANGHGITSNFVGGTAVNAGGSFLATSSTFRGIDLTVGSASATSVQGNVVQNIRSTLTGSFTASYGIFLQAGRADIGTVTGNTIGNDDLNLRYEISGDSYGIRIVSSSSVNLTNCDVLNFGTGPTPPTGEYYFGISVEGAGGTHSVVNNTVAHLTNASVPDASFNTQTIGMIVSATGAQTILGNTIHDVGSTSVTAPATLNNRVWGMIISGTGVGTVVTGNNFYNLFGSSTGVGARADVITFLQSQTVANGTYSNNMITGSGGPASDRSVFGILDLSASPAVSNYYHNSVSVNDTATGANSSYAFNRNSTATVTLRNNIFSNTRGGGTGLNVAIANSNAAATGWSATASNYNVLHNLNTTHLCQWLGAAVGNNRDLAGWQAAQPGGSGGDANTNVGDPGFTSSTDLHVLPSSALPSNNGTPLVGIVDVDFDNQPRSALAPDRGADEYTNTTPVAPTITAITRSTRVPLTGDPLVVTARIVDSSGVGITADSLQYSINGGAATRVAMPLISGSNVDGMYSGIIPGLANADGNRIQYQVWAMSGSGGVTTTALSVTNSYFAGISPMSITGVRAMDSVNAIRYKGYYARVAGTINGPNFQAANLSQYFQDGVGGLNLFKPGSLAAVRNLGDSVIVLGKLDQFRGVTEIVPDTIGVDIQTVATARPVPIIDLTVTQYNADPETYESRVVRFAALSRKYPGVPPWPPALTQAAIVMYQTTITDTVTMFINAGTNIPGSPEPTYPVNVASIAIQFAASGAATMGGYEVLPRYQTDFTHGPGLFGTYTVGVAGNYTTLSAAIFALDSAGVAGPVTFSLIDASYADTALIILPYAGQGPANMVTFRPANGVTARILIAGGSTATNTVGIRMDSVSGIVLDGSNSGGTDRSLTIESDTNTTTGRTPILIRKGSRNVTLRNLIVKGNRHSAGGIPSCVVIDNTGFAASGGQHNITVNNCQVMRGNNGIFTNAASGAVRDSNHTFTNNLVGGGSSASLFDHLAAAGITMTGNHNVMVADNDINGIKVAGTPVGIRVNGGNTAATVTRNRIHNMVTTSGAFRPLCILVGNIIATGPGVRTRAVISNNMVYDIHNFGIGVSGRSLSGYIYNPTGGASSLNGVGSTIEWYFNSMNVEYAAGEGGPSTNSAFYFDGNFAGTTNQSDSILHFNNIGSIKRADTLSVRQFLILAETVPGNAKWISNNNVYFNQVGPGSAVFAQIPSPFPSGAGVFVPDLATFRDSTFLDSNSVFGDPQFVSAADAHIRTDVPTPVESGGRPIAGITTDFDGNTRNTSTPDIGADEGTFMPTSFHDIGVASLGAGAAPSLPSRGSFPTEFVRGYAGKVGANGRDAGSGVQRSIQEALTTSGQTPVTVSTFRGPLDANSVPLAEGIPDVREQIAVNDFSMAYLLATAQSGTVSKSPANIAPPAFATRDNAGRGSLVLSPAAGSTTMFRAGAPLNFLARVQNFGTFDENSYQIAWTIDGISQTPVNSSAPLEVGDVDTLQLAWAAPTVGTHTARAWTVLGSDGNASNDTSAFQFQVLPAPNILFEEIFPDTTVPAGWLVVNNDGSPAANSSWRFSQQINFASGDTIRPQTGASFWFASYTGANAGGLIDEWLITPHILAADFDSLYFYCGAIGGAFPDSIRVLVSTTGNTIPSFTNQIAYFKVPGPIGSWNKIRLDLSAFDGQDIYIAINYYIVDGGPSGNNSDNVWVDHVIVTGTALPPPPPLGWTTQVSGISTYLYSVKAVNQNVAWAAGAGGKVLRTTNHGSTWDSVGGGAIGVADIYNVEALDANTAFVTTSPGATFIYKTTNGGATWTQVFTLAGGFINAIHMVDATTGYAEGDPVGATWTILKTTDGGSSWARMATEPTAVGGEFGTQNGLSMVGATHIWFNSNTGGRIYRSTNAGVTWSSGVAPFAATSNVWFNNTQYGLATGSAANGVARSTDGGATWTSVTVAGTGFLIACGGSGVTDFWYARGTTVYRSTDRGVTFSSSYVGTGAFVGLSFVTYGPSATSGWAVSSTGGIAGFYGTITGVEDGGQGEIPTSFALMQNYPNPFNPSTTIRFSVPTQSSVTLKVYNILGQTVATVVDEMKQTGNYSFEWNGRNDFGAQVASGVYFCRLEARPLDGSSPFASMKKMLFVK